MRSKRFTFVALAALLVSSLVVGACFAERRGMSRDGLLKALEETTPQPALPTVDDLVALRVPEPPKRPPEVDVARPKNAIDRAELAAATGDIAAAEKAWSAPTSSTATSGSASAGERADLFAHRCLVEGVLRRYDNVVDACTKFLDADAADPRAPAAVRILTKAKSGFQPAGDVVAKRGAQWVASCGKKREGNKGSSACADLAFLVADEREEAARVAKDRAALVDATIAGGRLHKASVEGPYDGDMRVMLARDLTGGEPLKPRAPFFQRFNDDEEDGIFEPSLRAPDGLYRMRFVANGGGIAHAYVTGSHAVRVRVDGVVVAERPVDLPAPSITTSTLRLKPGAHVVDVLAWSTGRGDHIGVSLLDDAGAPALHEVDARAERGAGTQLIARDDATSPAAAAASASATSPPSSDPQELMRLLWRQVMVRSPSLGADPDANRAMANDLVARFGWSPLALAVAAEAVGDDKTVPERVSSSSAARLWALVRNTWPDHPVARISEARNLREERPDEALHAYRALVAAQPRYAFGQRELIDVALEDGLVDEARSSANALVAMDPSADNLDAAAAAYKAAGDFAQAAALEAKRAKLDDVLSSTRAAKRALAAGRTDDGLAQLAQAAYAERGSSAIEDYAGLLAVRSPKAALKVIDEGLAQFPNDASLSVKKAELLASLEGDAAAKSFLVAALPKMRDSESAERFVEELGVSPPWLAHLALGDDVIAKRRAMTSLPFPGYPAVALLDDVERIVYEDDSSLNVRHLIVELRTKEVLDRFGEISTGDGRVVRLRVLKPDGSIVERERHKGVADVSLPQLTPGDVVELLTVDRDGPTRIGGSFETRGLNGVGTPALSRRYILSLPEGYEERRGVTLVADNGLKAPVGETVVDDEGRKRKRYVFAAENAAASPSEPFAPDRSETSMTGGFAWGVDAALWARLRGINLEQAALPNGWLVAAARKIAGDGDDEQKLRRIFAFVVRRIEPENAPDDASAVLATGQGQRTPLFVALLRAAGLDAAPVALQLGTQPDPSTFDTSSWSVIAVRTRLASRESYAIVDNNAVLDELPAIARGAKVLDLSLAPPEGPNPAKLVSVLPDDVVDDTGVLVQLDLGLDKKDPHALSGLVVVTIPPSKADGARRGVRRATPEQLRDIVERAFAESLPGLSVSDVKTPDLELAGSSLRLGAQVTVPLPETADGAARFDHLFARGASAGLQLSAPLAAYLSVTDRKLPMLVGAEREVLEVQLALPPTSAFVEAPEPLSLTSGPFALEQKVEIENGKLYWRREITKQNARIAVADWPSVRVGLAGLAARSDARLSFVAGGTKTDPKAEAKAEAKADATPVANRAPVDQNR